MDSFSSCSEPEYVNTSSLLPPNINTVSTVITEQPARPPPPVRDYSLLSQNPREKFYNDFHESIFRKIQYYIEILEVSPIYNYDEILFMSTSFLVAFLSLMDAMHKKQENNLNELKLFRPICPFYFNSALLCPIFIKKKPM